MINVAYSLLVNRSPDTVDPAPWERPMDPAFNRVILSQRLEDVRRILVGDNTNWWDVTYRAEAVLSLIYDPWRVEGKFWLSENQVRPALYPLQYKALPVTVTPITVTGPSAVITAQADDNRRDMGVPVKSVYVLKCTSGNSFTVTKSGSNYTNDIVLDDAAVSIDAGIRVTLSGTPDVGDTWRVTAITRPRNVLGRVSAGIDTMSSAVQTHLFGGDDENAPAYLLEANRVFIETDDPADRIDSVASAYLYHAALLL